MLTDHSSLNDLGCSHCHAKASIIEVDAPELDEKIFACIECDWWGYDPHKINQPAIKLVWPARC